MEFPSEWLSSPVRLSFCSAFSFSFLSFAFSFFSFCSIFLSYVLVSFFSRRTRSLHFENRFPLPNFRPFFPLMMVRNVKNSEKAKRRRRRGGGGRGSGGVEEEEEVRRGG